MGYSKEEQESSIIFDVEQNKWIGYSSYPPHITKVLKILGIDNVEAEYEEGRENPVSITFEMKANQISFRKGNKINLTDEQREERRLRALEMRKKINKD